MENLMIRTVLEQTRHFCEQQQVPGLALGIAQHGETLYEGGFGYRDVARSLPVTPDTLFGVASLTKSFAALAIMQLQDAGRLSVHDPVVRWLPEFRIPDAAANRGITIHHLLTHTSGLPGLQAIWHNRAGSIQADPDAARLGCAEALNMTPIRTYEEMMALLAEADFTLLGPPGRYYNYSNESYGLLQGIIERASGQPLLTYMQEEILAPLGMAHSCFRTADLARFPRVTELYGRDKTAVFHSPAWWDVGDIYTNGSLKSTVPDLLRYLEIYRTGGRSGDVQIVSPEAIRQMTHPHVRFPSGLGYGYGLQVQPGYHGVTMVGHGGGVKGVSAFMLTAPEAGAAAVVLTNLGDLPTDTVARAAINGALGLPLETPRYAFAPYAATPAELAELVGEYRNAEPGGGGQVRVVLPAAGGLVVEAAGQSIGIQLFSREGALTAGGAPVTFYRDEQARVVGLVWGARFMRRVPG